MLGMSGFADPDNFLHLATATLALYFGSVAAGGPAQDTPPPPADVAAPRPRGRATRPEHARAGTRRGVHRPETRRHHSAETGRRHGDANTDPLRTAVRLPTPVRRLP